MLILLFWSRFGVLSHNFWGVSGGIGGILNFWNFSMIFKNKTSYQKFIFKVPPWLQDWPESYQFFNCLWTLIKIPREKQKYLKSIFKQECLTIIKLAKHDHKEALKVEESFSLSLFAMTIRIFKLNASLASKITFCSSLKRAKAVNVVDS